jgi:Na+/H+ antiporter NhaA
VRDDVRHLINDGFMAAVLLRRRARDQGRAPLWGARRHHAAALPGLAAAGGAMLPALLFTAIVAGARGAGRGTPGAEGWAIP